MKPKIAIIGIRGYPANFAGASGIDSFIEALVPFLKKRYQLNLYIRSWTKPNKYTHSVPTINYFFLDTFLYSIFAPIIALYQKNDIFWFHASSSCILIPLVRLFGKKIIYTSHGIDWQRQKWSFPIFKYSLKFLDFIAVKFSHLATTVSPDQPYIFIPIGSPEISKSSRNKRYILYLGRFVPEKRINWLINAYNSLPLAIQKKYPLMIAGDNSHFPHQNFNQNITFTGFISGKAKQKLLSQTKLFVLPSALEGSSVALSEAISHQLVCLAADLSIHRQIAIHYPNLYLFKANSPTDLLSQLKFCLNQKVKPVKSQPYPSWQKTSQTIINLIDSL